MKLQEYDSLGPNNGLEPAYTTQDHSVHSTDVGFFNSLLEGSPRTGMPPAKLAFPPMLAEATQSLGASKDRITKMLNSTRHGVDIEKLRTFPLELGSRQLATQLLVKSLAKTTQSIEKISNLQ